MDSRLIFPGIRFNDCFFSEPIPLAGWSPPKYAGLCVMLAGDRNWAPKPFQPLFFGEFGNNTQEMPLPNVASGLLFVAVLPIPFSTMAQRWALRHELIRAYNPVFQGHEPPPAAGDLTRKVDELERKNQEQSAQVGLLLANMNRFFEPQAVPPRRRIGFLPQTAPSGRNVITENGN
jgi:hypothetical protein